MSRDVMDLSEKAAGPIESPLASPLAPPPGNLNTMDPTGWDEFLWNDIGFSFGFDMGRYQRDAISAHDAVGLSLAIQCADVKARDIAKAGMLLWKRSRRQWNVVEPNQHWFAKMLARRPNEFMTWGQFWRMVTLHFELAQNSYILKGIDRQGNVLELLPLLPARVRERMGENGRLFYEINASTEFERGMLNGKDNIIVPASRMIHLKGRLWNGLTGLSNVALGDPIFKLLKAISDYQTNLFNNDGKIPLVFETDQSFTGELADAAFRRLKQQLAERVRRMRVTNDPILLEAGLKAKQIAVNARDSMTAETFNAQVMRVCGLMQTPPHKIMAYESVKYDNQAAANSAYANDCLIPIADNFEETFRNSLLEEDEWDAYWPEFDRMSLMAGDVKTLMDVIDKAVKSGIVEVNEARERLPLALDPIEGGDVRYVPVNVAVIDRQGNVIQAATGQNPGAGQGEGEETPEESGEDTEVQERQLRLVATKD
jgi:HK97 family phage portal protein